MKFLGLRRFYGRTLDDALKYVRVDIHKAFEDLVLGLKKLSFADNFSSFTVDVTIAAGTTTKIINRHRTQSIYWFPVRISGDARLIEDGEPTADYLFIKNASTTSTTATLLVIKE